MTPLARQWAAITVPPSETWPLCSYEKKLWILSISMVHPSPYWIPKYTEWIYKFHLDKQLDHLASGKERAETAVFFPNPFNRLGILGRCSPLVLGSCAPVFGDPSGVYNHPLLLFPFLHPHFGSASIECSLGNTTGTTGLQSLHGNGRYVFVNCHSRHL
jgi:hypothetical protein